MPLLLCRHLDRRLAWRVEVPGDKLTLGCSPRATVPLPDGSLSQREASIERHGDRFLLRDLADQGRVKLGGTVTREALLRDGDRLGIGRVAITFFERDRGPGGEVQLFREAPPESAMQPAVVAPRSSPAEREAQAPPAEPPVMSRGAWLGILVLCLVAGFAAGSMLTRRAGEADDGATTPPPLSPLPAAPAPAAAPASSQRPDRGLDTAVRELKEELEPEAAKLEPETKPEPTASPPPAVQQGPPAKFELGSIPDADAWRLHLFRLFLDIAGRPPTRTEERELLGQPHTERWRRAVQAAPPEQRSGLAGAPEAERERLLGRQGTLEEASELLALVTADRPAAFWLTSLAEYRDPARRRPRSPALRTRSLIVDLLDRPPASAREMDAVAAALASPGGLAEAARTLACSPQGQLAPAVDGDSRWWEAEVFRFRLRSPAAAERTALEQALAGIDASQRRRWLLLALASLDDYGSY
jgi:hypothetical protein